MIADKFVDLYARNSGLRDKLIAERDVVLTYALRVLVDDGVMNHLAFKGGTCLRKLVFGSAGRFSEDLDFTMDTAEPDDDVLMQIVEVFNREHYGITFTFDEYYKTDDDTSFGRRCALSALVERRRPLPPAGQPARTADVARDRTAHAAPGLLRPPRVPHVRGARPRNDRDDR
jgi:nucleotidyltransferase AbiEii toxin of type IV toxin-antitoxin system